MSTEISDDYHLEPPPDEVILPLPLPPRPNLYNEVEWGQHVNQNDARIAYRFWFRADAAIQGDHNTAGETPFLHPADDEERAADPMHALARNIYNDLMRQHLAPISPNDQGTAWTNHSWSFHDIFPKDEMSRDDGDNIRWTFFEPKSAQSMKSDQLKEALAERGLDHKGTVTVLRQRLETYQKEGPKCYRALRRSDLSRWGVERADISRLFAINISEDETARTADLYTCAILRSPYNPMYWMGRAYCHYRQAMFDLAIGDAYRAQILIEVLVNPMRRNVQPGLYTLVWHAIEQHIEAGGVQGEIRWLRRSNGINYFIPTMRKALQNITCLGLMALQGWDDHSHFEQDLLDRVIMNDRDTLPFKRRLKVFDKIKKSPTCNWKLDDDWGRNYLYHERRSGWSCGDRPYPYEADDIVRLPKIGEGEGFAEKANEFFVTRNASLPWKKCKIAMEREQRYMMLATEDIAKDELIWVEMPSARGHLATKRPPLPEDHVPERKFDCDNCRRAISRQERRRQRDELSRERRANARNKTTREACVCIDSDPLLIFCPARGEDGDETCAENARRRYHFSACGKDWEWLHDAMRPVIYSWKVKTKWLSHSNEMHGTVLSLLLREVFDITLLRRKANPTLHAHEIDELLALEGRADWNNQSFPFTFAANIQVPVDILMTLGVDIFRDLSFDTWVIQLVLQKLLVNAVPWDQSLRVKINRADKIKKSWAFPKPSQQKDWPDENYETYDPTCRFLYLFPGFSFFDHECKDNGNARWGYDTEIPNRLLVWATKPIKAGEEIRISYISDRDRDERDGVLQRVLGKPCSCPGP
ncbi:hypothetical protein BP00DRAFT_376030, partial [Aspergillus indologenus CBS 114.80]